MQGIGWVKVSAEGGEDEIRTICSDISTKDRTWFKPIIDTGSLHRYPAGLRGNSTLSTQHLHFPHIHPLQILTQEDWNKVLYNGMASTSSWAALYFIALMTFGNYVLFNLLVAILVEGFQTEVMSSRSCLCFLLKFQVLQILEFDF